MLRPPTSPLFPSTTLFRSVEAKRPLQPEGVADREVVGVDDDEARRALDADVLQHEGRPVVEEAAGEPVLGDLRDSECAVNRQIGRASCRERGWMSGGGVCI